MGGRNVFKNQNEIAIYLQIEHGMEIQTYKQTMAFRFQQADYGIRGIDTSNSQI